MTENLPHTISLPPPRPRLRKKKGKTNKITGKKKGKLNK